MNDDMNDDRADFKAWVLKYNIGPGMNDNWRADRNKKPLVKNYSGFDGTVGSGWVPILDRLAADLIALGWDRDLAQTKEKFGTLRFYIGKGSEAIHARIHQAEDESAKTCEECGAPGCLRTDMGWLKTHCDACHAARVAKWAKEEAEHKAWTAQYKADKSLTARPLDAAEGDAA